MNDSIELTKLEWQVEPGPGGGQGGMAIHVAIAIARGAAKCLRDNFPDLVGLTELDCHVRCNAYFDPRGWFAIRLRYDRALSMIVGPDMDVSDQTYLKERIKTAAWLEPKFVAEQLGQDWISVDAFTYVGPHIGNNVSWRDIQRHFVYWLENHILPSAIELNKTRVMRALPAAPAYNLESVFKAIWVLESDEDVVQGTAFCLADIGLVTCDHSLGAATHAFHHSTPSIKYPIRVVRSHRVIDLAVLEFDGEMHPLHSTNPADLQVMDHLLVVGHPNYRIGDSPLISPGIVVGFRQKSAIRRIVTNAPIIAGASGGPVLNGKGLVIGVAVTGADNFANATVTEDHSIIPIDALDLLTS